mgnify:CR=1 FL=1
MNENTCIILFGRQSKSSLYKILKIIDFLNADLFLVYENDICNYSNHKNLKDKIKVKDIFNKSSVENQYLKIKDGWIMMEKYEKKNNIKYHSVFRIRCDINYELNENIDFKLTKNCVYLNSDYLFYGLRDDVKNCFYLYDLWNEFKQNNQLYNIQIINIINTIKNNPSECFDTTKWKYLNKLKSIPIPILKNTRIIEHNKNNILTILHNLNKNYKSYYDIFKNKEYTMYFYNKNDNINHFPCELSILLVLLNKQIIPINSNFIKVIEKY